MSIKVNNINPFINGSMPAAAPLAPQNDAQSIDVGAALSGQNTQIPQQTYVTMPASVDPSFTSAVNTFGQKYATATPAVQNAKENYSNNLSLMPQGALGEDALYVKGGRAGGEFNFVI